MTEKRFYYNTFYHADDMSRVLEYEIIDRQSYPNYPNHDEKEDIPNWYIYIGENDSGWQDMLIELLNTLHEENEQLRLELDTHKHPLWSTREAERIVNELKQENEQLRKELQRMYDVATLNKAIEVLENKYDKMLSDGSDEIKDAMRHTVLQCIDDLDELKDDITAR